VSEETVIPMDALQGRMLPVADFMMGLMLSRPGGLSLRDTRVTVVTIWLAAATGVGSLLLALLGLVLGAGGSWPWLVAAVALLALAFGSLVLAVFGVRQRRLMGRASAPPSS
jgi:hypothetical protein